MDALDSFTAAGAYTEFAEAKKGKLMPGMLADVIILNGNIEATPAAQMSTLKPVLTICDGRVTFEKMSSSRSLAYVFYHKPSSPVEFSDPRIHAGHCAHVATCNWRIPVYRRNDRTVSRTKFNFEEPFKRRFSASRLQQARRAFHAR